MCDHPNVVRCYGFCTNPYSIILEYIDGVDLCDFIHSPSKFTWAHVQDFIHDIACAMSHVHARGMLHRDLKATNFMVRLCKFDPETHLSVQLGHDGYVRLCDFGMGRAQTTYMTVGRGSVRWVAPEGIATFSALHVAAL